MHSYTSCQYVSYHEEMNPRFRKTMEDTMVIADGFLNQKENGYFAIFDGHGGRQVSQYLEQRLHENIATELQINHDEMNYPNDKRSIEQCIQSAYLITDRECCGMVDGIIGSTAITTLLMTDQDGNRILYTSNVGDSRAVLSHKGRAVRLSKDHKARDKEEQQRIENANGFILNNRVAGILAVSRSFGDKSFKEFIVASPHTTITRLESERIHPFLILACDGIWDELDDQEAVDMIRNLRKSEYPQAAKLLVSKAMARGSTDNMTCIVIFF